MAISIVRREEGYCCNCNDPKYVGYIRVPGWLHCFPICADCVKAIGDDIQKSSEVAKLPLTDLRHAQSDMDTEVENDGK